jgi:NAD(P)-dependent dehydrogenase (short-subunit alcohol dehydrogenase family)
MNTKTILITGGTTGIGLATAQLLSAQGARVIVTGRNPETLASAKKTLSGVVVLPSDSGDLAATQALGDEIKTFADHLDGAFLNAGIALLKRFGTSDEVARAARFLLSEDSSNITGTELIVDGGVRLN